MKSSATRSDRNKTAEELHWESMRWKSQFLHMEDELLFITRLLNSYVFEPNTPNLFERLLDYKTRIKNVKELKDTIHGHLYKHESELGGVLECSDRSRDALYFKKHEELKEKVTSCLSDFQSLKTEIFNYAGGILRKQKPDKKNR